ncbi:four-helix bundle copper-binding protein [Burkholderia sp. 4701]|nr:four-helix bundle copper-binding protein [Burkholderia sp. 4701]MXN86956.1 four-helix bundle copper-binding protein [Burkholderia sp. 4812]
MAHQQNQFCISACDACATACDHCAAACLAERQVSQLVDCIQLDWDCAALCRLASSAMARGSMQVNAICSNCANLCDACATECEQHQHPHCKECAQACRECAQACRTMAQ